MPRTTRAVAVLTAALLTVEGDDLYMAQVVELRERSTVVTLPILAAYRPDVYVSVSAVHGKTYARKELLLRVSPRAQQLTVQVTPDKPQYRPRETAVYTIRTLDDRGRPVGDLRGRRRREHRLRPWHRGIPHVPDVAL